MPPPWVPGLKIQDGLPVTKQLHDTLEAMLRQMNAAIDTLPDLTHAKSA